jgi:hypothetical protein
MYCGVSEAGDLYMEMPQTVIHYTFIPIVGQSSDDVLPSSSLEPVTNPNTC